MWGGGLCRKISFGCHRDASYGGDHARPRKNLTAKIRRLRRVDPGIA
jgi:hypothetical protein